MSTLNGGPNIVTDGLVLNLDAANTKSYISGSTIWTDISRSGNNGTLTNGPTFNNDNGGSIVFDSTNDMAIVPYNTNLNLCTIAKWTISIWINLVDNTGIFNCILGQWQQNFTGDGWLLSHSSGTIGFAWAPHSVNTNMITSNTPLVVGKWTYITLVKDNNSFILYQNAIPAGTFTNASTKNVTYQLELGRYGSSASYIGAKYSQVIIQHTALSPAEILQNYNATKGRFGL